VANAIYGLARQAWANAQVNWGTAAIHVDLIDLADYTVSINTHEFRSSVPAAARVASFGPLAGKTSALGVLDSNDFTFPTVTGDQAEALIYWVNTGSDASSRLLIFVDTATSGLPVTPNGGDINVVQNAAGIATL
jgi:hypothetical protein